MKLPGWLMRARREYGFYVQPVSLESFRADGRTLVPKVSTT